MIEMVEPPNKQALQHDAGRADDDWREQQGPPIADAEIGQQHPGRERAQHVLRAMSRDDLVGTNTKVMQSVGRSEEHTSELQSLMRIAYAVFCLKQKKPTLQHNPSIAHPAHHPPSLTTSNTNHHY